MKIMSRTWLALCGVAIAVGAPAAFAQAYPAKPVRMIVGFPAGGPIDIVARMMSPKLGETLGQQVVVD
ncbi:MAG: tripartite tricarboxylate transporter substrate binding protein, partial [Burkholderiales bacterium]